MKLEPVAKPAAICKRSWPWQRRRSRTPKLFQAPLAPVSLGQSTTGCFAYDVWVYAKLLVVASNVWQSELSMLRKADHDWLVVNSVLVDVQEPLWLE